MDAAAGGLADDAELAALRDALAALGATAPLLVYRKTLHSPDVCPNQSRLLIPCRSADDDGDASALTAFLTAAEKGRVRGHRGAAGGVGPAWRRRSGYVDRREPVGLEVPAYDRHGRRFIMRLTRTESIRGYRFCGAGWQYFVRDNQVAEAVAAAKEMGRELEVELWAFRSAELLPEGRRHPDGALGLGVAILVRN